MQHQERGSTLVVVMLAVSVLTVLGIALSSSLLMSARASNSMSAGTQSLMGARSGLLDIYAFMKRDWAGIWQNLTSDASNPLDLQAINLALAQLQSDTQAWIDIKINTGQPYGQYGAVLNAQIALGSNNEQSLSLTNPQLLQNYGMTVTAEKNGVSQKFFDTITVGGPFLASGTGYAAFATKNLYLTGAPEIDGNIAAGGQLLIDGSPWYWAWFQGAGEQAARLSPDTAEPFVKPALDLGSFTALAGVNGFNKYSGSGSDTGDGTLSLSTFIGEHGSSTTFGAADAAPLSDITTVLDGNPVQLKTIDSGSYVDVSHIITTHEDAILSQLSSLTKEFTPGNIKQNVNQVFSTGGEVKWNESDGNACEITSAVSQSSSALPIYFQGGTLEIGGQGSLTLTQPMYVDGDLVVSGAGRLVSSQPIYVSGNVIIATATSNSTAPLKIYSQGDILMLGNLQEVPVDHISDEHHHNGDSLPANTPTTVYGNFASASNVYVDGMYGDYQVIGQLYGTNIILNGTIGNQIVESGSGMLQSANDFRPSYRRLVLTGAGNGLTQGPPGLVDLQVLPLPQPTLSNP